MNVNYNNLYCDYIGATGGYSISDYIDITSNTLAINSSNFTSGTSNILNDKIDITSNTLNDRIYNVDYKYNNLINEKIENNLINTYIYNSNLGGEIRFYNKKPIALNRPDYSVRINNSGYLEVYYNYNALINAIEQEGYKNIVNEIISSKASINLQGGFIGTLQLETAGIIGYLIKNRPQNEVGELLEAPAFDRTSTYTAITTGINAIGVRLQNFLFNNRYALFLGSPIAPIIFLFAQYGASVDASHIIAGAIIDQYDSNTTMTSQEKADLLTYGSNIYVNKVYDSLNNLSNLNINLGFINSNIQTQQYINSLNTIDFRIDNINISNIYVSSNVLSNLNINLGFINSNIQTQQYIKDLKCDTLNLNTGNIANINGINANEIIAAGKIKQNNILLDETYLTSNHLYNLAYNYTSERQYPSKLYNTILQQDTITLLGQLENRTIFYLDNQSIAYGSGVYEIYYSSQYDTNTRAENLFNYDTSQTTTSARFGITLYSSGTGDYLGNDKINNYYGDWLIIKMPQEILLSRYRIYQRTDAPTKAPSLWKVFGSKDGITFTEITQASQTTRLTSYTNNYYEKTLSSFTTLYQYFGFVFGSLLSVSGQTDLSFAELQIFGKEIISNTITSNIYTTSNAVKGIVEFDMPIVSKHYAFYITITTPIIINNKTYYKYDIDLRQYTKLGYIQIGSASGDSYRIFKLRCCFGNMYFSTLINNIPDVLYSDIFMSMKANATPGLGAAGLNICSIGNINNPRLDTVPPNNLFFMRNGANSIDYITVVSTNPADVRCFIEDMIS